MFLISVVYDIYNYTELGLHTVNCNLPLDLLNLIYQMSTLVQNT
jgi:hypothetical protein